MRLVNPRLQAKEKFGGARAHDLAPVNDAKHFTAKYCQT